MLSPDLIRIHFSGPPAALYRSGGRGCRTAGRSVAAGIRQLAPRPTSSRSTPSPGAIRSGPPSRPTRPATSSSSGRARPPSGIRRLRHLGPGPAAQRERRRRRTRLPGQHLDHLQPEGARGGDELERRVRRGLGEQPQRVELRHHGPALQRRRRQGRVRDPRQQRVHRRRSVVPDGGDGRQRRLRRRLAQRRRRRRGPRHQHSGPPVESIRRQLLRPVPGQ